MNFKKLTVLLLALFVIGGSTLAFAWWDNLENAQEETIELGTGVRITVEADNSGLDTLVPSGAFYADFTGYTTSQTFTYTVGLEEELVAGTEADLLVTVDGLTVDDLTVDDLTLASTLFNFAILIDGQPTFTFNAANSGATVEVTVVVTMSEPTTEAEYEAVAGQTLGFNVDFELKAPPTE